MPPLIPLTVAAVLAAVTNGMSIDDYLYQKYVQAPLKDQYGEFGHKDNDAAALVHMSTKEYVVDGWRNDFKGQLAALLHGLDDAGFTPCINSGYRGPERQAMIKEGFRASPNGSYHGGTPGNRGHGEGAAADLVSCYGSTQDERTDSSTPIYDWIDKHPEFGFHRPYRYLNGKDPGHVSLIKDGEFARVAKNHGDRHSHVRLAHHRGRHYAAR